MAAERDVMHWSMSVTKVQARIVLLGYPKEAKLFTAIQSRLPPCCLSGAMFFTKTPKACLERVISKQGRLCSGTKLRDVRAGSGGMS